MSKYNHTPEYSKPQYGANNAYFEGNITTRCGNNNYANIPTQPHKTSLLKNSLTSNSQQGYDECLSKIHASGQAKPLSFGFFVPKIYLDPQSGNPMHKHPTQYYLMIQGESIMPMVSKSPTSYDGMTLQNTIALRQICRAVACVTESESHHPMNVHSVVLPQKLTQGGHYHA